MQEVLSSEAINQLFIVFVSIGTMLGAAIAALKGYTKTEQRETPKEIGHHMLEKLQLVHEDIAKLEGDLGELSEDLEELSRSLSVIMETLSKMFDKVDRTDVNVAILKEFDRREHLRK